MCPDARLAEGIAPELLEREAAMSSAASPAIDTPPRASPGTLLKERFTRLWQRCLLPGAPSDPERVWSEVERHYEEAHRHYHDKEHLAHCLEQLDLAAAEIDRPDRIEMAIWFHDVVNDPGHSDNEARSAEMFRDRANGLMGEDFLEAVVDLILVTTHRGAQRDREHQFICDIDLTSFGCPWERYVRDTRRVKAEFQGPEEDYYRSKRAFLEDLLARPRIFQTDFFHDRYEERARGNIQRLLGMMERHEV